GAFEGLARAFLPGRHRVAFVVAVLVALPFVLSIFITNDVSLLTFVPFACLVLGFMGRPDLAAPTVVLQAIAANMGSMLTPFGNPHNLFIYEVFGTPVGEFLATTSPFTVFSAVLIALVIVALTAGRRGGTVSLTKEDLPEAPLHPLDTALFAAAFLLCVLCVLKLVPVWAMLIVVCGLAAVRNWRLFAKVDWFLLGTFLCFFVFSGNLAAIPAVHAELTGAMSASPFWITLGASQVISNVPATALLSGFTADWRAVLLGADIGGLGTPVGSLANLIALGLYRKMHPEGAAPLGRYMVIFLALNFSFLALNCGLRALVG
ncbi:MAG: hypothetical protein IKD70_02490, partial [Eggerthellaceae bacterium]|nr:hypothetical protein [Eggerthellaceae bacterium]